MQKGVRQKGQALVIVLLSLAVVLTIVLFILARSTTDIAVSSRSEEATRAFSAAEAGVENALVIGTNANPNFGSNSSYTATVTGFAENSPDFIYPIPMNSGDSMTTWFVSHDSDGNLSCNNLPCFAGTVMYVCWGDPAKVTNPATDPAIEVSVFYETTPEDISTLKIARLTADPRARTPANNFETAGIGNSCPNGATYAHSKLYTFANRGIPATSPGNLLFARIRMFYNTDTTQPLAVTVRGSTSANNNAFITLPSQGQSIISTGTTGQSNRRVQVYQGWPEPPEVFDFAIYSGTGLTK